MSDYEITEAMIRYGGGFVSRLGQLWQWADDSNQQWLKAAFPDYWTEYAELAKLRARTLTEGAAVRESWRFADEASKGTGIIK